MSISPYGLFGATEQDAVAVLHCGGMFQEQFLELPGPYTTAT